MSYGNDSVRLVAVLTLGNIAGVILKMQVALLFVIGYWSP